MNLITPDFGLIFWQTVTLLVVLLVLGRFAWKPILYAIQERERRIEDALQAASVAKETVARVQADQDALRSMAYAERKKILEEAKVAQQAIVDKAREEAEQVREKMMEKAREHLAREKEANLIALKNTVATLAIQMAEKLLQKELKQQRTQEELVQQLLKEARWG